MPGVKGQVQARGIERRRAIVDAAIEHFGRAGYRGTGIAAVAAQAGVTTGGVLHHFGSKEGLLVEVLKRRDEQAVAAFDGMHSGTAADDFALWVEVASYNEERHALTALHAVLQAESIAAGHPARDYFLERNRSVVQLLEVTLRRGVDSGELRADLDVPAKAAEIHAFVEGAGALWLHAPRPGVLRDLVRSYFDDQLALLRADL